MNKDDFYKFLKNNNLDGEYEISKYFTENYSLANAVSLVAKPYKPIFNAYDVLKNNEKIRVNLGLNNNDHLTFYLQNGFLLAPERGVFRKFDEVKSPILIDKTDNYFYADIQFNQTDRNYQIIPTQNFGITFLQNTEIRDEILYYGYNEYMEEDVHVHGQYFYACGYLQATDPQPIIIPNIYGLFPKMNLFLNTDTAETQLFGKEYNKNYRLLLFGNRKLNTIHAAYYDGPNQELYPLNTIKYKFEENTEVKIIGNVGFYLREPKALEADERYNLTIKSYTEQPKITAWLKTISINRE